MMNIEVEIGADGIAVATFDTAGRAMNTITLAVQEELGRLAERVRTDDQISGLILKSCKASGFCAGADLGELEQQIAAWRQASSQEELRAAVDAAGSFSRIVRAIESCGKPVVTIVHGVALGGGLELALAGHRRIATGDPGALRLGLPEATIGLMPGAGGTQRLPRLMGLGKALPHLLEGKPIALEMAVDSGLLHEHIAVEQIALDRAARWIAENPSSHQPWDAKGYRFADGPHSAAGYASFPYLIAQLRGDGPGEHAGRSNILRAVYEGLQVPIDAGLRIEARYFFNTLRSASAGAMLRTLFVARQALAKTTRAEPAPYRARLAAAWTASAHALVDGGASPSLVAGVVRGLSTGLPPIDVGQAMRPETDIPDPAMLDGIRHSLLLHTAQAARAGLAEGLVTSAEEADLAGIECGFPSWTGGPLSFLRANFSAGLEPLDEPRCGWLSATM